MVEMKSFVGTCVNSFDADGDCIVPQLGWANVSDFANAEEYAKEISESTFIALAEMPNELTQELAGHSVKYLVSENVLMAYDDDKDIHYFFA